MQVPKAADADKEYFRSVLPPDPHVEVRPMFGNLGAFVNGNMFAGLFGSDVGVKLRAADQDALRAQGGGPFGPSQRPMGGYVSLPRAWRDDPDTASDWVTRAFEYVGSLPAKIKKSRT